MRGTPVAERLYRWLLRCYPGEFREEYEREMLELFRDRLGHDRRLGVMAQARLWMQVAADSVLRAPSEHLDVLRQDLRYALRSLRRAPLFATTAIATLALGIGANTAMFSIVHAVALNPLPYESSERLIRIWEDNASLSISGFAVSLPNYVSWGERAKTVDLAAWTSGSATLRGSGDPVRVPSVSASARLFEVLRVRPVLGRLFDGRDEPVGAPAVVLLTEGLWRTHFGSNPSIVGSTTSVGGQPHTVVGVVPNDSVPGDAELFLPLRVNLAEEDRSNHLAQVMGRLRDGVTFEQARGELERIARELEQEFPGSNKGWGVTLSTVYDWLVPESTRNALYVLLASVGCVLLIAAANVASLMLARAAGRKRELAVRLAIGAARRRLVRQVLTEGMLLALLGGAAGVLIAYWSVPLLKQWLPASLPRAGEAVVSGPVLLFSLAVCFAAALVFAAVPAVAGSRANVVDALKEGARGAGATATRWRQALAVVQVALATVLLVGAALLLESLQRLQRVDLGFDLSQVTTAMTGLPNDRYRRQPDSWRFYQALLERLSAAPGVQGAAITSGAPFDGGNTGMPIDAVGQSRLNGASLQADWRMVSPGYFTTLRIPLLRGRFFSGHTGQDNGTLIVSSSMARRIWGDEDPLGRQIKAGPAGDFTVVGVVGDVRNLALALEPAPTMYISTSRYIWPTMTVVVRAPESAGAAALIRTSVRELDPQLAVHNIRRMEDQVAGSASQPRLNALLIGMFAAVAAALAAIGIYGVLAFLVSQRRQEIGIRVALGAGRASVVRLVLARGVWLTVIGLVAGVAGALVASRSVESLLFGVSARDPIAFVGAAALVTVVAVTASYLPARRAAGVDPIVALRAD